MSADHSLSSFVGFSLTVIKLSGFWPWSVVPGWRHVLSHVYMRSVVLLVICHVMNAIYMIVTKIMNNKVFVQDLEMLSFGIQMAIFYRKQNDLINLLCYNPRFDIDYFSTFHSRKYQRKATNLCYIYVLLNIIAYLIFLFTIIMSMTNATDHTMNVEENLMFYLLPHDFESVKYITIALGTIDIMNIFVCLMFNNGVTMLYTYIQFHIQGYLSYLRSCIERFEYPDSATVYNLTHSTSVRVRIVSDIQYCVSLHKYINEIADETNKIFAHQILQHIFKIFVLACTAAFDLSKVRTIGPAATHMLRIMIISWYLFNMCWNGQVIQVQSAQLEKMCLEHVMQQGNVTPEGKLMLVMAANVRKPLRLYVGPFATLSMKTFCTIVGIAFTYFVFLKNN